MKRSAAPSPAPLSPAALSPEARELLALGSFVEPPTAEQDARMDRAVARLIALDRAAAPAARLEPSGSPRARGSLARAPRAPVWRLRQALPGSSTGKLWLAVGALAATAGASFWVGRASVPDGAQPPGTPAALEVPVQPAVAARVDAAYAAPALASTERSPLAASAPSRSPQDPGLDGAHAELAAGVRRAPPLDEVSNARHAKLVRVPAAAPSPSGLSAEIQRLARAEAALRQGRAQQALVELELPAAHLLEHAAALRAIAECTLDRSPGVTRAREALLRWPGSAFAPRVRDACGL